MERSLNRFNKLLGVVLALLCAPIAYGQGAYVPARSVNSNVNGVLRPVAGAFITVCAAGNANVPCAPPLAGVLFKDQALTQPLANPTTTDLNGNYPTMALAAGNYTITETATGFTGFSYQITVTCGTGGCSATSLTITGATALNSLTVTGTQINTGPATTITALEGCQHVNASQTFAAALAAASTPGCIEVDPGTYTVGANATIPTNVSLKSTSGGLLSIATAVTLTINGPIVAPSTQIFSYTGTGTTLIVPWQLLNATWFPGADIHAQANNAFSACNAVGNKQCGVEIPANGSAGWTTTTTLTFPYQNSGGALLQVDPGTFINYTGTSDAWQLFATSASNNNNFVIRMTGASLVGFSQGCNGLHLRAVSHVHTYDLNVKGFTASSTLTCGNGVFQEGVIDVFHTDIISTGNNIGLQNLGWSGSPGSLSGSNGNGEYPGGRIQANAAGGVFESAACGSTCINFNNLHETDIEGNGNQLSAPISAGSLTAAVASNVVTITGLGSTNGVKAGMYLVMTGCTGGSSLNGNFFLSGVPSTNTFTYTSTGATGPATGCSASITPYQVGVQGGHNIQFKSNFMQWSGSPSGFLAEAIIGDFSFSPPQGTIFDGVDFNSAGSTNSIFDNTSIATTVMPGVKEESAVTSFYNCQGGGLTHTRLQILADFANIAATNFQSGCGGYGPTANFDGVLGLGSGLANDPGALAGLINCYYNTTINQGKCNFNNSASGVFSALPLTGNSAGTHSDSGFYQTAGASGCTTAASIGGVCATAITITWPVAFQDANYKVICTPVGPATNLPSNPYVVTPIAASVTINYFAITAAAASWPTVNCEAVHN